MFCVIYFSFALRAAELILPKTAFFVAFNRPGSLVYAVTRFSLISSNVHRVSPISCFHRSKTALTGCPRSLDYFIIGFFCDKNTAFHLVMILVPAQFFFFSICHLTGGTWAKLHLIVPLLFISTHILVTTLQDLLLPAGF